MALTPAQQQSVNNSGGYYDATGNWVDMSSSAGAGQGATASGGASGLAGLASLAPLIVNMLKGTSQPNPGALIGTIPGGQDLVNSVTGQIAQQAPLRQAVSQQAMNMLPDSAFPGGRPALAPVPAGPGPVATPPGNGVGSLLGAGAAGAGLTALLASIAGGANNPLSAVLTKLLGGGGASPNATGGAGGSPDFVGPINSASSLGGPGDLGNMDPNGTTYSGNNLANLWFGSSVGGPGSQVNSPGNGNTGI